MPGSRKRRHLFILSPIPNDCRSWPFFWDLTEKIYFRPESGGLLVSPCDETDWPAEEPSTDPSAETLLAEKLAAICPSLLKARITHRWAGLRTFASDSRFVAGRDPKIQNLYWIAALGGQGVAVNSTLGAQAAQWICGTRAEPQEQPFSPSRFTSPASGSARGDSVSFLA
ncbi:MAG TPA: FAD-binding oxidoreductase [Bdellovibrionota bacterium]|nr:FAD-binding oxidoreductase [Bdellovibrionota bacterium]